MNIFRYLSFIVLLATISNAADSLSEEKLSTSNKTHAENHGDLPSAFSRLKRLEGFWDEAEYGRVIEYRLTGKGSALIEEFTGDPPMTSVYHLDGDDLRLTHYCNAGNQPRMIAALYESDTIKFEFVDVTNLSAPDAYHTRTLDIQFQNDDQVILNFVGLKGGKEIATTHTLTRRGTPSAANKTQGE